MDAFFHDEDIAKLFKMTLRGLRNKIDAGDPLPPYTNLPGLRVRLWPRKAVEEWVLKFVVGYPEAANSTLVKRRGRPHKNGQAK